MATTYIAYIVSKEQNNNKRQVCFENANTAPPTAVSMRCNTRNAAASSTMHTTHENSPTDSNKGAQNKQNSNNDQHQDGHPHNDDTKNTNQESKMVNVI